MTGFISVSVCTITHRSDLQMKAVVGLGRQPGTDVNVFGHDCIVCSISMDRQYTAQLPHSTTWYRKCIHVLTLQPTYIKAHIHTCKHTSIGLGIFATSGLSMLVERHLPHVRDPLSTVIRVLKHCLGENTYAVDCSFCVRVSSVQQSSLQQICKFMMTLSVQYLLMYAMCRQCLFYQEFIAFPFRSYCHFINLQRDSERLWALLHPHCIRCQEHGENDRIRSACCCCRSAVGHYKGK